MYKTSQDSIRRSSWLCFVKDIGYIRVQYAPVIARVCGFARGAAECKKPQTSVITGVYCTSMHPISDLLP